MRRPINVSTSERTRDALAELQRLIARRTERRSPVSVAEVIERLAADALSRCEADPRWVPEVVGYDRGSLRWTAVHVCVAAGPNALDVVAREIGDGLIYVTDGARPVVSGRQAAGVQPAHLDGAALVAVDGEVDHAASLVLQLVRVDVGQLWPVATPVARCRRVARVRPAQAIDLRAPAQASP